MRRNERDEMIGDEMIWNRHERYGRTLSSVIILYMHLNGYYS